MIDTIQATFFDLAALDTETRIVVQQEDKEFDRSMGDAGTNFLRACHSLRRIHEALRYKRPGFDEYCESKPGLSRSTAYKMLSVAKMCPENGHIAIESKEAIYLLAAPSTPASARDEVLERIENGHAPSIQETREIITDHRNSVHASISDEDYDQQIREAEYQDDDQLTPYEEEIARRETIRLQQKDILTASSKSNEWYTPAHIIEAVRNTLGGIDLDPASCAAAQQVIRATTHYTAADDGYSRQWGNTYKPVRVFLNPPYGKESGEAETNAMRWSKKLIAEYEQGNVSAAILLVKAALGYAWFEELWYAWPTCFLRERLWFTPASQEQTAGQSKHATALLYFGPDVDGFRSAFRSIGRVVMPETNSG